jgi:hypothetical protein
VKRRRDRGLCASDEDRTLVGCARVSCVLQKSAGVARPRKAWIDPF